MAFPVIAASQTGTDESSPFTLAMPAGVTAGNLLIAVYIGIAGDTFNLPSGWSTLLSPVTQGELVCAAVYKFASGSETSVEAAQGVAGVVGWVLRITGAHASTPPECTRAGATANATANPPSETASWGAEDNLWIAFGALMEDGENSTGFTAPPTNYTSVGHYIGEGGGNFLKTSVAYRNLNTATEDPGTFTENVAIVDYWHGVTIVVRPAAGGGAYSITADVGAYTLSGQNALRKLTMGAGLGTYTLTGQDARKLQSMIAAVGTYVLTGNDVNFIKNSPLTAEVGVYVLSGQNVTDPGVTYTLDADAGTYALTGNDAGTLRQLLLACATGTYSLVGQDSTGDFTLQLTADVGAYILSGQDTTGDSTYRLSAEVGGYTLSGVAASLLHGYTLPAAVGEFALSGNDVAFLRGYNLVGEAGSYELSGQDVRDAFEAFTMIADQGAYNIIGVDVTLRKQARRLWVLQSEASSEWTEEAPRARRNVH